VDCRRESEGGEEYRGCNPRKRKRAHHGGKGVVVGVVGNQSVKEREGCTEAETTVSSNLKSPKDGSKIDIWEAGWHLKGDV